MTDDYRPSDFARDSVKGGAAAIWIAAIAIIAAIVIGAMAVFGFGLFERSTAGFRGGTEVINKTKGSGAYRIAHYNHFFELCAAVQSDEATIEALEREEKKDLSASRREQVQASITANEANRAEDINQYNVEAREGATAGQFKASNLPYELNAKERPTKCAS